jgi:formylglycine-generating enzyme required for sulfatase activity
VLRGGSWVNDPWLMRVPFRNNFAPDYRGNNLGFRLALSQ